MAGYFGGSNALWRTDVLRRYEFDRSMLTEDVDGALRHALGLILGLILGHARLSTMGLASASIRLTVAQFALLTASTAVCAGAACPAHAALCG